MSASNGIVPSIFPRILSENGFDNQYSLSFNGFSGFLYYDEELSVENVLVRAERALEIIKKDAEKGKYDPKVVAALRRLIEEDRFRFRR